MSHMAEQLGEQDFRRMAAMWADTARHQMARFEDVIEIYVSAQSDYEFRAVFYERGEPSEWASENATRNEYLTQHQL